MSERVYVIRTKTGRLGGLLPAGGWVAVCADPETRDCLVERPLVCWALMVDGLIGDGVIGMVIGEQCGRMIPTSAELDPLFLGYAGPDGYDREAWLQRARALLDALEQDEAAPDADAGTPDAADDDGDWATGARLLTGDPFP